MNSFLTGILASSVANAPVEVPEDFLGRFLFGLQYSATGILVVFLVLFILMLVVKVFEILFYKRKIEEKTAPAAVSAAAPAPVAPAADDDAMIAAVIAAAVDAYYANAQSGIPVQARKKYQIRSFRRI